MSNECTQQSNSKQYNRLQRKQNKDPRRVIHAAIKDIVIYRRRNKRYGTSWEGTATPDTDTVKNTEGIQGDSRTGVITG